MKSLSAEFRRALYNDERNYLAYADITLANSTVLHLTNSEIWGGGFSYEEAVSGDDEFSAIGSVIIGSATLIINNIYGTYSEYDFANASVVLYLGMQLSTQLEKFKIGTYTVDDTSYNGATIKLSLLDYMEQFDRPYNIGGNNKLQYPATLDEIVRDACSKCGVVLGTYNFPHKDYEIPTRPDDESITFREVLSWCATIAGCFVKCDPDGKIELKWFDQSSLEAVAETIDGGIFNPWETGNVYNGGVFNPWNTGTEYNGGLFEDELNVHVISALYKQNVSVDDVVITGVSINVKDESDNAQQNIITYSEGTSGYVIELTENPFVTKTNAEAILDWLGQQLIGLRFRKLDVSIASDPSIEAGDVAVVIDRKQNVYFTLITRTNFSADSSQTVVCGASTPSKNSATKYSSATKSYVETRKLLKQEKTERELVEDDIRQQLANGSGLHYTAVPDTSVTPATTIYYLHDKTLLADSDVRIKFSKAGIAVTANGKSVNPDWYGLTVSGDMILNLLASTGILFDWASGGTLTLGGNGNSNGVLKIKDANGNDIVLGNRLGLTLYRGLLQSANGSVFIDLNNNLIRLPDGSISSNMLSIGDFNNYATINPNFDNTMCQLTGNETEIVTDSSVTDPDSTHPIVFQKKTADHNNLALATVRTANNNTFTVGDEIYFDITARVLSGSGAAAVVIACYDNSGTFITSKAESITLTSTYQQFTGTLSITNSAFDKAAYVWFYIRDDRTTKAQIRVRSAKIWRKFGGNVVIDGSLTAGKIHGGELKLGGLNNENGSLGIYDNNGTLRGTFDKDNLVLSATWTSGSQTQTNYTHITTREVSTSNGTDSATLSQGEITTRYEDPIYGLFLTTLQADELKFMYYGNQSIVIDPVLSLRAGTTSGTISSSAGSLYFSAEGIRESGNNAGIINFESEGQFRVTVNRSSPTFKVDSGAVSVTGSFTASGTKSRVVETDQYSDRLLYAYETASPMFGDVGEGVIGEDGLCYVFIDPIFAKTVSLTQYQVFLQKYGAGECYVCERHPSYFIVYGTIGLSFGWEIKAKQIDYNQLRLERNDEQVSITNKVNYITDAEKHLAEIKEGRLSA